MLRVMFTVMLLLCSPVPFYSSYLLCSIIEATSPESTPGVIRPAKPLWWRSERTLSQLLAPSFGDVISSRISLMWLFATGIGVLIGCLSGCLCVIRPSIRDATGGDFRIAFGIALGMLASVSLIFHCVRSSFYDFPVYGGPYVVASLAAILFVAGFFTLLEFVAARKFSSQRNPRQEIGSD